MVQVEGNTYRVVRLRPGLYEAVRVLDDTPLGTFRMGPPIAIEAPDAELETMRAIARAALREARTSWVRLSTRS